MTVNRLQNKKYCQDRPECKVYRSFGKMQKTKMTHKNTSYREVERIKGPIVFLGITFLTRSSASAMFFIFKRSFYLRSFH